MEKNKIIQAAQNKAVSKNPNKTMQQYVKAMKG